MKKVKELPFRKVWWLNPSYIVGTILIPLYLLLWFSGYYTNGEISTAKGLYFFHGEIAFLGFVGLFVLYIGTLSPIKYIPPPVKSSVATTLTVNLTVLTLIGYVSIIGYLYWFKDIILNPGLLISQIQQSASIGVRGVIERESGIASLAQIGLVYVMFFLYQWLLDKSKLNRVQYFLLYSIVLFILLRVFLWSERLAIIEMMIAIVLVWVSYSRKKGVFVEKLFLVFPLFGFVFIVLFFALGEYFRSWSSFYINQSMGFWEFILQRMVNYYFEALNTGSGLLATQEWPSYEFGNILDWLHKLPFIGGLFSVSVGFAPNVTLEFLNKYADPEFNNPSGIFTIFFDIGIVLGLLFLFLIGVASRFFYAMLADRVSFYGLFYFVFIMILFELFRYLYLGSPRSFMVLLGFLILVFTQKKIY